MLALTPAGPRNPFDKEQLELRWRPLTLGALEADPAPEVSEAENEAEREVAEPLGTKEGWVRSLRRDKTQEGRQPDTPKYS